MIKSLEELYKININNNELILKFKILFLDDNGNLIEGKSERFDVNLKKRFNCFALSNLLCDRRLDNEVDGLSKKTCKFYPSLINSYLRDLIFVNCIKAIVEDTKNISVYYFLGNFLLEQGEKNEAMEVFKKVIEVDPNNYKAAYILLGKLLIDEGKINEAIDYYRRLIIELDNPRQKVDEEKEHFTIKLLTKYSDTYVNLADFFADQEKNEKAKEYYKTAIDLSPNEVIYKYYLNNFLFEQGMITDRDFNPNEDSLYNKLEDYLFVKGILKSDNNLQNTGKKKKKQNNNFKTNLNETKDTALHSKNLSEMKDISFKESKILNTHSVLHANSVLDDYPILNDLSVMVDQSILESKEELVSLNNNKENSISQQKIETNDFVNSSGKKFEPKNALLIRNQGDSYLKEGKIEKAEEYYRIAIKLKPKYSFLYSQLGNFLLKQGRKLEAEDNYKIALNLEPFNEKYISDFSDLLLRQERYFDAEQFYRNLVYLHPNNSLFQLKLSVFLLSQERKNEAEDCFRKLVKLDPLNVSYLSSLGDLLNQNGKFDEANELYKKAKDLKFKKK